jgi:rhodanese-related sulfurtransferase
VRSASEWAQDHLEDSINIPLPQLLRRIGELSREAHLTVLCGEGYRSSIAVGLLKADGFERLSNVAGGMQAVRHLSCNFTKTSADSEKTFEKLGLSFGHGARIFRDS